MRIKLKKCLFFICTGLLLAGSVIQISHAIFEGVDLTLLRQVSIPAFLVAAVVGLLSLDSLGRRWRWVYFGAILFYLVSFPLFRWAVPLRFKLYHEQFRIVSDLILDRGVEDESVNRFVEERRGNVRKVLLIENGETKLILLFTGGGFPNKSFGYAFIPGNQELGLAWVKSRWKTTVFLEDGWWWFSG